MVELRIRAFPPFNHPGNNSQKFLQNGLEIGKWPCFIADWLNHTACKIVQQVTQYLNRVNWHANRHWHMHFKRSQTMCVCVCVFNEIILCKTWCIYYTYSYQSRCARHHNLLNTVRHAVYARSLDQMLVAAAISWPCIFISNTHSMLWCPRGARGYGLWRCVFRARFVHSVIVCSSH